MSSTEVSVEYIATGANRQTAAADWSRSGVLAFGAQANVALWRPCLDPPQGIFALLSGHRETVKAVKFLPEAQDDEASYLVSGSDDKTLLVWKSSGDRQSDRQSYRLVTRSQEHEGAVNCITAVRLSRHGDKCVIASGAADATIRMWTLAQDQLKLVQTIATAPKLMPLSLCLAALDAEQEALVLAAGGTGDGIQILTGEAERAELSVKAKLSGHEGWIRSVDIVASESHLLLASASQDKYVRIWRLERGGGASAAKSPSNKAYWVTAAGKHFSVTFEALLLGHDDWIYSAQWHEDAKGKGLQLLTASADNSLAIWQADASSGIWVSTVRLGEISREKGATTATGSTGGFWTGSWRTWQRLDDSWQACVAVSGHTRPVTGIAWAATGRHVVSTSADQTTRLHGQWAASTWHELARPQIHGYDLNCIGWLGPHRLVSGADEKLMRVFAQPRALRRLLSRLAGDEAGDEAADDVPDAADMPEPTALDTLSHPPLEETLSRHTLWPETEKLYGHGYEISPNHAVIRLFETTRWTELRPPLIAHSLTATRLRFSLDDALLLSVGRDRQWATNPKGHSRMILDAAWAPPAPDSLVFATAGRDKQAAALPTASPVTSIDFLPRLVDGSLVLAVGTEAGRLSICLVSPDGSSITELVPPPQLLFSRPVLQLAWRPCHDACQTASYTLAAAGEDSSLRLFTIEPAYLRSV
ncbi:hypothetical protein CDD81_3525 [Ophiocordyceps australis]|uniref:Elongator complex protein 2 n=1 Tax=Ophiocordyceps australis TaxID=1399860 RepID=A0A2C5XPP4_9HYPO|nr:hypothetical protein CDD81_3525 [Ophiocordyceps australis]